MGHQTNQGHHTDVADAAWLRTMFLTALVDRLGTLPAPLSSAADQLVAATLTDPHRRIAALIRFASALGTAGWDLATVSDLVERLAELVRQTGRCAEHLVGFGAGAVAGRGWAHGYLPLVVSESCTDSLTGLATLGVLSWRLHQVYDQCRALGVDPRHVQALVIVDLIRTGSVLERDVSRVAVAELLRRRFRSGETLVATGTRLLALVSRTPELDDDVALLVAEARCHPTLRDADLMGWVEDLPPDADGIERYLLEVV